MKEKILPHLHLREYHLGAAALALPLPPFYTALFRASSRLLSLPAIESLRPLARRLGGSLQPAGRLVHLLHPPRSASTDPATLRSPSERPRQNKLVILSANLCHDYPLHRRQVDRLETFARLVESYRADILLLQEVSRTPRLYVDDWLARRLGMAYLYARANGDEPSLGFEEGLAVFSRYPVGSPQLAELGEKANPFVRRLALGACIQLPGGDLPVYSVHLGIGGNKNAGQLAHLRQWVAEQTGGQAAVVGGDFNTPEHSLQIRQVKTSWLDAYRLHQPHSRGDTHSLGRTFTGGNRSRLGLRRQRLDYIFLQPGASNWQVEWAEHLADETHTFSDHQAVAVKISR